MNEQEALHQINAITEQFFDLFTNADGRFPEISKLEDFFLSSGIIINNTGDQTAIYNLEDFIQPREELLTNGSLLNFKEYETSHITKIHGNIAHRISQYKKSGELKGNYFVGEGTKMLQFIKLKDKWLLSSVVWTDNEVI